MTFIKGHKLGFTGHHWSESQRQKWLEKMKGRRVSIATEFKKGHSTSKETRKVIVENHTGSNNKLWKGDKVGYRALHEWVERKLGKPTTCEDCGKSNLTSMKVHWANLSGDYQRNLNDWKRMCVSCHKKYDLSKK